VVLHGLFGIDQNASIIAVSVLTGLYTILGGLLAVVLTESIQAVVLLLGAICITAIAYYDLGGWSGLAASVEPVKLTILRSADDPCNLPWYSVFLGYPVIGLWYWCADQTIVQRVLGAKDENHARLGPLFAGFIKILPVFIFVLPGLLCLGLIHQGKLADPPEKSADIYAYMIANLLPPGLRGLAAASLLAALMSTVSGALNSTATLFSYDIYKRWNPNVSDRALVRMGRWVTFVAMAAAILWSPHIGRFESIFQGINALISYISPPITAVFVWGVFWRRASSAGALMTLWGGAVLGIVVFYLDWNKASTGWNVPFMMSAFYLFAICSAIMILVSFAFPHRHTPESAALVWNRPLDALRGPAWRGIGNYKFVAAVLFITVSFLYYLFA